MRFCPGKGGRCRNKVTSGRCAECARASDRQRGSRHERGYTSEWERARLQFLREYPLCGHRPTPHPPVMSRCYDEQRVTAATVVDHVVPHRGDRALFWARETNWQSLCRACHDRKVGAGL